MSAIQNNLIPSPVLPDSNPMATGVRYPKRSRQQVCYNEETNDDKLDDEDAFEPQSKRAKTYKKSKPLPKHKIFPFMSLPAELRNKIYQMALIGSQSGPIFVTSNTKAHRRVAARCTEDTCDPQFNRSAWGQRPIPKDNNFAPNILAVSKTIHAEAAFLLYSRPIFVADNNALLTFLSQIGPRHSTLLKDITVGSWCDTRSHKSINFPAMALLAQTTNLERLDIASPIGYFSYHSWRTGKPVEIAIKVARHVFRDCYPWLESVGRAKGDIFAAIYLLELSEQNFEQALCTTDAAGREKELEKQLEIYRKELERLLSA